MTTLSEIVNEEIELDAILSKRLKKNLSKSKLELKIVNEDESNSISEMDLLIEETFPSKEVNEHKPSILLYTEKNPLCIVCLKNGVVIGGMTVNFDFDDKLAILISIAVDVDFRNKQIGSLLMLALHDICCELDIASISLISSSAGKLFYKSFGFKEMAHDSFECSLPFEKNIIQYKLSSLSDQFPKETENKRKKTEIKRSHESLISHSIFKNKDINGEQKIEEDQNQSFKDCKRRK